MVAHPGVPQRHHVLTLQHRASNRMRKGGFNALKCRMHVIVRTNPFDRHLLQALRFAEHVREGKAG